MVQSDLGLDLEGMRERYARAVRNETALLRRNSIALVDDTPKCQHHWGPPKVEVNLLAHRTIAQCAKCQTLLFAKIDAPLTYAVRHEAARKALSLLAKSPASPDKTPHGAESLRRESQKP